jgi:hypothetical protein
MAEAPIPDPHVLSTKVTRKEDDVYITFHSELTEVSAVFPKSTSMVKFVEWCQEKFQGLPVGPEAPILVEVNTYHFQVREGRVHGLTMDSFLEATAEYAMDPDDTMEKTDGDHSQAGASESQPGASESQPGASESQPGASESQPAARESNASSARKKTLGWYFHKRTVQRM